MSTIVAEGISKRYRIGEYKAGYETLRDTLSHAARRALRLEHVDHSLEELWALKDVSFSIEEGEVVGFIGKNGSGKSTLLKILTRITPPTEGTASIRGRVGSILEVGTGFHPELTGRENTYLNGAILGMKRREIQSKFDEIVEFSGIEKFIDTPVKRYSSGMYVRLAFAVAAHLDPEVLIIDEVLAVGDYEFQQRCMGRIEDISSSGRTVIFVSHDMRAVTRLCNRAYWLQSGRLMAEGDAEEVVSRYLQEASGTGAEMVFGLDDAPGNELVRLVSARVVDSNGDTIHAADIREPVGDRARASSSCGQTGPMFPKLKLGNDRGEVVFNALDTDPRWRAAPEPGTYTCTAWIPGNLLNEGVIGVDVAVASYGGPKLVNHVNVPALVKFHVQESGLGDTAKGLYTAQLRGGVLPAPRLDDRVRGRAGLRDRVADDLVGRLERRREVAVRQGLQRRGRAVGGGHEDAWPCGCEAAPVQAARVAEDHRPLVAREADDLVRRHASLDVLVGHPAVAHRHPRPHRVMAPAGLARRDVLERPVVGADVGQVDERLEQVLVVEVDMPVLRRHALVRLGLLRRVPEVDVGELRPETQVCVRDVEHPPRRTRREPGVVGAEGRAVEAVGALDELLAGAHLAQAPFDHRPLGLRDEGRTLLVHLLPDVLADEVGEAERDVAVAVESLDEAALDVVEHRRMRGVVPA